MPRQKSRKPARGPANPNDIPPLKQKPEDSTSGTAKAGDELLQVIIETPRGSRNKYSFDEKQRLFVLKSVLPAGMVFPHDFGFIPRTIGGDGDPLDVLVLTDEPCFSGCALLVRLLGVMEAEQTQGGKTVRNDRLLAVADASQSYSHLHTIEDLPPQIRTELSAFFATYHRLQKKDSKTLAWKGPNRARKLIEQGLRSARQAPGKEQP